MGCIIYEELFVRLLGLSYRLQPDSCFHENDEYPESTVSTPINQWENLPHYTNLIIREDLTEIRIIEKS